MVHPVRPAAWLAGRLADFDDALRAGELITTGGITAAVDMEPGSLYTVRFGEIGSIDVRAT
jgi:2-keto-4-pentenoate hydratase